MINFHGLGQQVLSTIARELVQDEHRLDSDVLELLPLRLTHPQFTPSLTHWIFHTVRVKGDGVPESRALQWIKAKPFLKCMEVSVFRSQFTNLKFEMKWPARDWELCMAILLASSQTVKAMHLSGEGIFTTIVSADASGRLLSAYLQVNTAYYCLTDLVLGGFYIPLLPRLLSQSPKLERLIVGDNPSWLHSATPHVHLFPVWDHSVAYRRLQLLRVNNASEYGVVDFLRRLPTSAVTVELSISPFRRSDTQILVNAVRTEELFAGVEAIRIIAMHPSDRYIAELKAVLNERKISVGVQRLGALDICAVDHAILQEHQRSCGLRKWRVPQHSWD